MRIIGKFKWWEIILFLVMGVLLIQPVENLDFWFHVKYGEHIVKTGALPFTDLYSHTAYGESAVPYEWLFQVTVYFVYSQLGNIGVQIFVVLTVLGYLYFFKRILSEIFHLNELIQVVLTGFVFVVGYDFWVERPQIVAYLLFMITVYMLLKKAYGMRVSLWWSLPVMLIWVNLHASFILGLYLYYGFSTVSILQDLLEPARKISKRTREFLFFAIVNTLISVLPPLGVSVYQLLLLPLPVHHPLLFLYFLPIHLLNLRSHHYLLHPRLDLNYSLSFPYSF